MPTLIALLVMLQVAQDKTTVENVIAQMEKNTAALNDLSFEIETSGVRELAGQMEVTVKWRRGTGLRIHATPESGKARGKGMVPPFMIGPMDVAYCDDALYMWRENDRPAAMELVNQRMKWSEPAASALDPFFLPIGLPIRLMTDDPFIYYELDPRFFLGKEPNLTYEGKRTEGGKTCHVLSSHLSPSDLTKKLNGAEFQVIASKRKEFHIDVQTGRLVRIRWEASASAGREESEASLIIEAGSRESVAGNVSLVSTVTWTAFQKRGGALKRQDEVLHRFFKNFRANQGIAAEEIISQAERSDLFADAALLKPEEYDAILKEDPQNAAAWYSRATARGTPSIFEQFGGQGGGNDPSKVLDDLEKTMSLRPDAESVVVNFLSAAANNPDRAKAVLKKIEEGAIKGDRVLLAAAGQLNARNQFDRALKLLDAISAEGPLRRRAVLERMHALALKKDVDALLAAFAEEAKRCSTTREKIAFVGQASARVPIEDAEMEKLLANAAAKAPAEIAFRLALTSLRKTPDAAAALIEAAPADEAAIDFAMEAIAECTEFTKEQALRLKTAVDAAKTTDPRISLLIGRALKAAGETEGAKAQFSAALEKASLAERGQPGSSKAVQVLFELSDEAGVMGGDEWLERLVAEVLRIAPDGAGVPRELQFRKNPITLLAAHHIEKRRWVAFYRLMTTASDRLLGIWAIQRDREVVLDTVECAKAIQEEILKDPKDTKACKTYARFANQHLSGIGAVDALEKAREFAPKDVELLWLLGQAAGSGDRERAIGAYEAALPVLESPVMINEEKSDERTITRSDVLLELVKLYADPQKAKDTLGKIDLKADAVEGSLAEQVADQYAKIEEWDQAIAAYLRAHELGSRPNVKLGRAYEKKQDFYEALRWYNRDIAEGSSNEGRPPDLERFDPDEDREEQELQREPRNGNEAREALLKKLGPDFTINKFIEQKFEPLAADEQARVAKAIEQLAADDVAEREAGVAELRKIGPRATPQIKDLLKSDDNEVRARVRGILKDWAEPK